MKKILKRTLACLLGLGLILGLAAAAAASGHYVPGVEGVDAGSVPPPGFHYRMYNLYYTADTLKDKNGNDLNIGFDAKIFATVHRFIYMTPFKVLGADYGFDLIAPMVDTDLQIKAMRYDSRKFGLGDICLQPIILGWHQPRWDIGFSFGAWMPTGQSGTSVSPGLGYWSIMGTLGGTYYMDEQRTWSVSVLTRWLKNFENRDTGVTPGAELVAEWGIGKMIPVAPWLLVKPGIAGFSYLQLSDDDGTGSDSDRRAKAHAIGPEVNLFWLPPALFQVNLRYLFEFNAESEPEGQRLVLTLTKSF